MPNNFMFQVGTLEERAWMKQAACLGMDPELFFPEDDDPEYEVKVCVAKDICSECPVMKDCLNWAMTRREYLGIWGNTTHRERKRIRLKKR